MATTDTFHAPPLPTVWGKMTPVVKWSALTVVVVCVLIAALLMVNSALPSFIERQLNEHVQLEDTPFYVSTSRAAWEVEPGEVRRAAVSSFGFSGTNAHMVLEEAPASEVVRSAALPVYPMTLSARTPDQLKAQVAR